MRADLLRRLAEAESAHAARTPRPTRRLVVDDGGAVIATRAGERAPLVVRVVSARTRPIDDPREQAPPAMPISNRQRDVLDSETRAGRLSAGQRARLEESLLRGEAVRAAVEHALGVRARDDLRVEHIARALTE